MFKIQKTDKRFKANSLYNYQAKPLDSVISKSIGRTRPFDYSYSLLKFLKARNWCTEQWGAGHEIDVCLVLNRHEPEMINPHWAYEIDYAVGGFLPKFRIYLKGKEEASFFALVWANGDSND